MITVAQLGQVFVKATQFLHPEAVEIVKSGIRHDREFALVEDNDGFIPSAKHGEFFPLKFTFEAATDSLCLEYPDGRRTVGQAQGTGRAWGIDHVGLRTIEVAEVEGPWTAELSAFAGRTIRLARCLSTSTAIDVCPLTLLTTGALRRVAREVGGTVEAARFRAGLVLDNHLEHEEDGWDGRRLRIGTALLKVRTAVPRCQITGFNPSTGVRDQEVMKALIRYRRKTTLPDGMLPDHARPGFASYAEVIEPGWVRVGDTVEVLS
ncbi:MAG: MOSC domain-containing protein [Gammaproteobacteria bacterium]|nr:MOSC domain-containing protein [Gammaproteobacteria bacterium]